MSGELPPIQPPGLARKTEKILDSFDPSRNIMEQWKEHQLGAATLYVKQRDGRTLYVVGSQHFSLEAIALFRDEIAPRITDPSAWLFMLEGSQLAEAPEFSFASELAEGLDIPVCYPIIDYQNNPHITDLYLQTPEGADKDKPMVQAAIALSLGRGYQTTDFRALAKEMGVSYDDIITGIVELSLTFEDEMHAQVKAINRELLTITNAVSAQIVDYMLRRFPEKTHIAMLMGYGHVSLCDIDTATLPEELRLSDENIDDVRKVGMQQLLDVIIEAYMRRDTEANEK